MNRIVNQKDDKKFIITFMIFFIVALVIFISIFVSINNKFKETSDLGLLTINTTESIVPNDNINTSMASASQDKSINDIVNSANNRVSNQVLNQITSGEKTNVTSSTTINSASNTINLVSNSNKVNKTENVENESKASGVIDEPEIKKEISFMAPVVGEIITDYADESLVYSKTLDEWTTHLGIDIKANKASSVVSAEEGIVKSIKNDPRYGLTIIISHDDGYETLYSNLLSADFVKEGDKVTKNQTIGTIGESASFEISDPPHLHFEILKNGENINPTTLIK